MLCKLCTQLGMISQPVAEETKDMQRSMTQLENNLDLFVTNTINIQVHCVALNHCNHADLLFFFCVP